MKKIPLIILFLLLTADCFSATQLKKTVKPSGGDYTSLEACMNANEQNLVTADKYFDVEIDGDWGITPNTIVPTMTSNTAPSGTASADVSVDGTRIPFRAFDRSNTNGEVDCWHSDNSALPHYLQYQFPTGKVIKCYSITNRNAYETYHPTAWTFYGSNDGSDWTELDSQTSQDFGVSEEKFYNFTNTTSYTYYRITVTAVGVNNYAVISELKLCESQKTSTPDTTAVTIHNYTTDATRYINIYTTSQARHNGTGVQGYVLNGARIYVINSYFTINGLQVSHHPDATSGIQVYSCDYGVVKNNIVRDFGRYSGISFDAVHNLWVYNNLIYNGNHGQSSGIYIGRYDTNYVYNNTIYNIVSGGTGIYIADNCDGVLLKNNISIGCSTDFFNEINAIYSADYNISLDATAEGDNSLTGKTAANQFIDLSQDLHLKLGADAINTGLDLSASFTTDIDGTTRPTGTGTWDIGADEYVSTATANTSNFFMFFN